MDIWKNRYGTRKSTLQMNGSDQDKITGEGITAHQVKWPPITL